VQVCIVDKKDLHERLLRIDPEYYQQIYLEIEQKISKKRLTSLNEVCYITDGEHGTLKTYKTGYAKYYGARNVLFGILDETSVEYITKEDHQRNKRSILHPSDVLISCVGANIGSAAYVPENIGNANIVRNLALLRSKSEKINNEYLLAYFLSKYGKLSFKRVATGNAQPLVSLDNIYEINIPILNKKFQNLTRKIIKKSSILRSRAEKIYFETELLLLSNIGLDEWIDNYNSIFVKNYSETIKPERLDAEYFLPKYDNIVALIKKYKHGFDFIKNQFKKNKSYFTKNNEKCYNYVEISGINVLTGEYQISKLLGKELPANAKIKTKINDLIISKVRTYRGAISIIRDSDIIASNAFTVLQSTGNISPETLFILLRSKPYLTLTLKFNTGTSYPTINDDDILNMPIPLIDKKIQNNVTENIKQYYALIEKNKELFMIAKNGVDIAIEKNEKEAIDWVKDEIKNLGLDIHGI